MQNDLSRLLQNETSVLSKTITLNNTKKAKQSEH